MQQQTKQGYFFEFKQIFRSLKAAFKGRFWHLFGLLALIALPVAVVSAYTSNTLAGSIVDVLPALDINTPESLDTLLSAMNNGLGSDIYSTLLTMITSLLQCAMFIYAAVFTYESLLGRKILMQDSSRMAIHVLKKLFPVFLIIYMASYLMNYAIMLCAIGSSFIIAILPVPLIAIPISLLFFFAMYCFLSAAIDSYSTAITVSYSLGRVRFMFTLLYARLLYRGNYLKTVVYYIIIGGITTLIGLIPTLLAIVLSYVGSPVAIVLWGVSSLVQSLLSGFAMCFYTARILQLEKKNLSLLQPLSFVVTSNPQSPAQDENTTNDNPPTDGQDSSGQ